MGAVDHRRSRRSTAYSSTWTRSRVLDLGCGNGVPHARALVEHGHEVVGVDSSVAQLNVRAGTSRERRSSTATRFAADFPAGSFDGVLSAFVFGHIPTGTSTCRCSADRVAGAEAGRALITFRLIGGAARAPWLGTPMFFSAHPPERSRALLAEAGLESVDGSADGRAGHGSVSFIWTLSRRPT